MNHSTAQTTPISIAQQERMLRNVYGTFDAEGITLSASTRYNLNRIVSGEASCQQVLDELREKYEKRAKTIV